DAEQDPRRQAERVERDEPECEVERGADLAVRDRRDRPRPEDATKPMEAPWQATSPGRSVVVAVAEPTGDVASFLGCAFVCQTCSACSQPRSERPEKAK